MEETEGGATLWDLGVGKIVAWLGKATPETQLHNLVAISHVWPCPRPYPLPGLPPAPDTRVLSTPYHSTNKRSSQCSLIPFCGLLCVPEFSHIQD